MPSVFSTKPQPHGLDLMLAASVSNSTNRTLCSVTLWYSAIRCGEPEDIINGILERKCQTFGCRISYACEPGYQLLGRTHRLQNTWINKVVEEPFLIADTVKLMALGVPKYFPSANVRKIRSQQFKLCTFNDFSRVLPSPSQPTIWARDVQLCDLQLPYLVWV